MIVEQLRRISKLSDVIFIPFAFSPKQLPRIDIQIQPTDLEKLYYYTQEFDGRIPKKTVPAVVIIDNKEYKAKVRYRGQNPNHWTDQKKSWRITFKKGTYWQGLSEFNLIIPYDREYLVEGFSFNLAEKLGLAAPRHEYAIATLNGGELGVYILVEQWSNEMLEFAGLKPDTDLYSDKNQAPEIDGKLGIYGSINNFEKKVTIPNRDEETQNLERLLKLLELSSEEFKEEAGKILDMDNAVKWMAHSTLIFSRGQQYSHNIFFYFDRSQGRFQFIPWNTDMDFTRKIASLSVDEYYNPLMGRLLEIDEFTFRRNRLLWEYVTNEENVKGDYLWIDQWRKEVLPLFYQDRIKLYSNLDVWYWSWTFKKKLRQAYSKITDRLKETEGKLVVTQVEGNSYQIAVTSNGFSSLKLESIKLPEKSEVVLVNIDTGEVIFQGSTQEIILEDLLIHSQRQRPDEYFQPMKIEPQTKKWLLSLKTSIKSHPEIILLNAISGEKTKISQENETDLTQIITISRPDIEIDQSLPSWIKQDQKEYIIRQGTYYLNKSIIFPEGRRVTVKPGVILRLAPGISMINFGSFDFQGTIGNPIRIERSGVGNWGVVACVRTSFTETDQKCRFLHTLVDGGGEGEVEGIYATGALTSHGVPFEAEFLTITGSNGDDALNIKQAVFSLRQIDINHNKYDGVDLDLTPEGLIEGSQISNNGNDGIDFGSAKARVINTEIFQNGDKCISVGERSKVFLKELRLSDCPIGIAVKDVAEATLENSLLKNMKVGISQYIKKPLFGEKGPLLKEEQNIFEDVEEIKSF